MDFLLELLEELLLDSSIQTLENKKAARWKRWLAYTIYFLFLSLSIFLLLGAVSLSIITFKNKEYAISIVFGVLALFIIIWLLKTFKTYIRKR